MSTFFGQDSSSSRGNLKGFWDWPSPEQNPEIRVICRPILCIFHHALLPGLFSLQTCSDRNFGNNWCICAQICIALNIWWELSLENIMPEFSSFLGWWQWDHLSTWGKKNKENPDHRFTNSYSCRLPHMSQTLTTGPVFVCVSSNLCSTEKSENAQPSKICAYARL